MPAFYHHDLFSALRDLGADVQVIYARALIAQRVALGWQPPPMDTLPQRTLTPHAPIRDALREVWRLRHERTRWHFVHAMWGERSFMVALLFMRALGLPTIQYCEAPNPHLRRSPLKRTAKALYAHLIGRLPGAYMFTVAEPALALYPTFGYPVDHLYPLAYHRRARPLPNGEKSSGVEIVFAGQLIERKGVDILIQAIRPLFAEFPALRLTLIGSGGDREALERLAADSPAITFTGALPYDQIEGRIAAARLFVLPSRWDGWGLVVNEALSVGVPVLCSDQCGAAAVIRRGVNGDIFPAENVMALRERLREFLSHPQQWTAMSAAARATSETLSAEQSAAYMMRVFQHLKEQHPTKPTPPWIEAGEGVRG
ncbi:MAG: glycosyltransferase family 4 protein [Anaerolineales bacterium]|nr:glycosyltransferase family 4 protein [Anaerolineales bacterium]